MTALADLAATAKPESMAGLPSRTSCRNNPVFMNANPWSSRTAQNCRNPWSSHLLLPPSSRVIRHTQRRPPRETTAIALASAPLSCSRYNHHGCTGIATRMLARIAAANAENRCIVFAIHLLRSARCHQHCTKIEPALPPVTASTTLSLAPSLTCIATAINETPNEFSIEEPVALGGICETPLARTLTASKP